MEKIDYEKLYKESLERAKKLHKDAIILQLEQDIKDYEYIFPVLKESEDENIRKDIIKTIERHIEHVFQDESYAPDAKDFLIKELKGQIAWLKNQGEQKSADKVEPKFHEDDWIVSNVSHEDYRICKILKIENGEYVIESIYGYQGHNNFEAFDKDYRLWTIQDAKDGDVLQLGKVTSIFKKYIGNEHCICYCSFCKAGGFEIPIENGEDNVYGCHNTTPATKEQRYLLFQKIKEAGYEWDAEKKELKKINSYCQEHCKGYQETGKCFVDGECQAKKNAELSWSEEDEYTLYETIKHLEELIIIDKSKHCGVDVQYYQRDIDWLKSLKDRVQSQWKPSDEQLDALHDAAVYVDKSMFPHPKGILMKMYKQLKKLSEE